MGSINLTCKILQNLCLFIICIELAACSGGGNISTGASGSAITPSVRVQMGPVLDAIVACSNIDANGDSVLDVVLAGCTSDVNGDCQLPFASLTDDPVLCISSEGTYTDEATLETRALGDAKLGILLTATDLDGATLEFGISIASSITARRALELIVDNLTTDELNEKIAQASTEIEEVFGVNPKLKPAINTDTDPSDEGKSAALLAATFSQLRENLDPMNFVSDDEFMNWLFEDYITDGVFNGRDASGNTVSLSAGDTTINLDATHFVAHCIYAQTTFLDGTADTLFDDFKDGSLVPPLCKSTSPTYAEANGVVLEEQISSADLDDPEALVNELSSSSSSGLTGTTSLGSGTATITIEASAVNSSTCTSTGIVIINLDSDNTPSNSNPYSSNVVTISCDGTGTTYTATFTGVSDGTYYVHGSIDNNGDGTYNSAGSDSMGYGNATIIVSGGTSPPTYTLSVPASIF